MKNLHTLKMFFLLDLILLKRILIEIVFLSAILISSFMFFLSGFQLYLFTVTIVFLLSTFFIILMIIHLNKEREKWKIMTVYKKLPLNNMHIYLSNFITPLFLFLLLNYIPTILLTILFKNIINSTLCLEQITFIRFFYMFHFLGALIILFFIFLFINGIIFLGEKIKSFIIYLFLFLIILSGFKNKINLNFNIELESIKMFVLKSGSINFFHFIAFFILILLLSLLFIGNKRFNKIVFNK